MSQLSDKILSYPVETYIPMHSAVTLVNPEMYGTYLPTATPYLTSSTGLVPTYESTSNPAGAEGGSWRFNTPTTSDNQRIRMNETTYLNEKVWDGEYGLGFWLRLNSIPIGTSNGTVTIFSAARQSSFPGFSITLRGTAHASGPGLMHNMFSSTTPIVSNPQVGTWYYIVGRKNKVASNATIWVNGVKVATGNNTTAGPNPITSAQWTYQPSWNTNTGSTANAFSYNMCHWHLMDFSNFTDAAISQIYQAGITAPSTRTVRYFNGTSWVDSVGQKVWNGTAWVDWNAKRFDGSTWVNV